MRHIFFLLMLFSMHTIAQDRQLYLINTEDSDQVIALLQNPSVDVNYLGQNFVLATSTLQPKGHARLITSNAWAEDIHYYLIFTHPESRKEYLEGLSEQATFIFTEDNFVVAGFEGGDNFIPKPAKNDGMVRLWDRKATIPASLQYTGGTRNTPDPFIASMIEEVDASLITATVQHLEDYGTRNAYTQQSFQAQAWLADEFESLGLEVEIMDFSMPGGNASDNVIATLTGTLYPEEYVVVGAHYDSYSNSGGAPGADDNASGTAGVLEIARIMSQYSFDRTLIFCAFSGEEYGLYGSEAYASRCAQEGMDIHGYFNLDMIGYLQNGSYIHTDLIYPSSAQELADFYTDICGIYLPDFPVEPGMLQGGDSDHTSFNNNGFMGIFPFEDSQNYSPYIHTSNDKVGPSYNNAAQARVFVQASLASAASLANRITPPRNLKALGFDNLVKLSWSVMEGVNHYNIYRDNNLIGSSETADYEDFDVINDIEYQYQVTAVFTGSEDESDRSSAVAATPRPLLSLPYADDFETGETWWETSHSWGLTSQTSHSPEHSLADSPNGDYQNNVTSYAYLRPFGLNGDFEEATVSFWTRFGLESGYDYVYFEISVNGENWVEIAEFNGTQQTWQKKTYSLNNYLGAEHVQLRFRFYSDTWVTDDGIFIDDFEISRVITTLSEHETGFTFYPNPATDQIRIETSAGLKTRILIMDALGRTVKTTEVETPGNINVNDLIPGVYFIQMASGTHYSTAKLVVKSNSVQ
jgi:hypothetical protein